MTDAELIDWLLTPANEPELEQHEKRTFTGWRDRGWAKRGLSPRERAWAMEVYLRLRPIDTSKVPRGREVPTPAVLADPKEALKRRPPR